MQNRRQVRSRQAMALPIILIAIVLLAILATSAQYLIRSQTGQVQRVALKHHAFYQAEAGYDYAMARLVDGARSVDDRWYWKNGKKRAGTLSLKLGENEAQIFVADICNGYRTLSHLSIFSKGIARHRSWSRAVLFRGHVRLNPVKGRKGKLEAVEISRGAVDVRRLVKRLKEHRDFYVNHDKARRLERNNPHYMPGGPEPQRVGVIPPEPGLEGRIDEIIQQLEKMIDDDAEDGSGPDLSDPAVQRALEALLRRDDNIDSMLRTVRIHDRRKRKDRLDELLHSIPTNLAPDDFFDAIDENWQVAPIDLDAAFDIFTALSDAEIDLARIEDNLQRLAQLPADLRIWPRGTRATFNPQQLSAVVAQTLHRVVAGFREPAPQGFGRVFESLTDKIARVEDGTLVPSYAASLPQGAAVLVPPPGSSFPPPQVGSENEGSHPAELAQGQPELSPEPMAPIPDGGGTAPGVSPPEEGGAQQATPGSTPSEASMDQIDSQTSNAANTPQGDGAGMGATADDTAGPGADVPADGGAAAGGDPAAPAAPADPGAAVADGGQPAADAPPAAADGPADAGGDQVADGATPAEQPAPSTLPPDFDPKAHAAASAEKGADAKMLDILKVQGPKINDTYTQMKSYVSDMASSVVDTAKGMWNSATSYLGGLFGGGTKTDEGATDVAQASGDGTTDGSAADGAATGTGSSGEETTPGGSAAGDGGTGEGAFPEFGVVPNGYALPEGWDGDGNGITPEFCALEQEKVLSSLKEDMVFRAENYEAFGPVLPEGVELSQENVFADGLATMAMSFGAGAMDLKNSIAQMATSVAQSVGGALAGLTFTGEMIQPYPVAGGGGDGTTVTSPAAFLGTMTGGSASAVSAMGAADGTAAVDGMPGAADGDPALGADGNPVDPVAATGTNDGILGGDGLSGTDGAGALPASPSLVPAGAGSFGGGGVAAPSSAPAPSPAMAPSGSGGFGGGAMGGSSSGGGAAAPSGE